MNTKQFNSIILNLEPTEVTSGLHKDMEMYATNFTIQFELDCDIEVVYYMSADYTHPEEYDFKQTKLVSNIEVFHNDADTSLTLTKVQIEKLAQELEDNINVVY